MRPTNPYDIGQTIILEAKTTLENGNPVAPDNPRILLRRPDGTEVSLAVVLSEVLGTWFHELYLAGPGGLYTYRLLTETDAEELVFYVRESSFSAPLE